MIPDEKLSALLEMFKDAPEALDDVLAQAEIAALDQTGKAQLKALRVRITTKAAQPLNIFDSVSQWLTSGGDPRCL